MTQIHRVVWFLILQVSAAAAACRRQTCLPTPTSVWLLTGALWRHGPCFPSSQMSTDLQRIPQRPAASTHLRTTKDETEKLAHVKHTWTRGVSTSSGRGLHLFRRETIKSMTLPQLERELDCRVSGLCMVQLCPLISKGHFGVAAYIAPWSDSGLHYVIERHD